MQCVEEEELKFLVVSSDIKNLELGKSINDGSFGEVYESRWFGLLSETKVMDVDLNTMFGQEVSILVNSSHLNVIKYFYDAKNKVNEIDESSRMNILSHEVYLVMELMQANLNNILEEKKSIPYYFLKILFIKL